MILTLDKPYAGRLELDTLQRRVEWPIRSIGVEPQTWDCGGLRKQIDIYRLPDRRPSHEFAFSLPLTRLHKGDNPIYVRVTQEDGHMAWTSPIYLAV